MISSHNAGPATAPPLHKNSSELSKIHISSTMAALKAALADLKSSESTNYAATAAEHGCDETTLRRRHQGKQVSRQDAAFECRSLLSKQRERELISYINKLTARGLPPTTSMVWNFAQDLAKSRLQKTGCTSSHDAVQTSLHLGGYEALISAGKRLIIFIAISFILSL